MEEGRKIVRREYKGGAKRGSKYIGVKNVTLTVTKQDEDDIEELKEVLWIKTKIWVIRKALATLKLKYNL